MVHLLLRFQVGVVYVYAGLAKATGDWLLHAQPLSIWLSARTDMPVLGALFDERLGRLRASAGRASSSTPRSSLFLLWAPRRASWAYVVVLVFHVITRLLFPIGMFPFIMVRRRRSSSSRRPGRGAAASCRASRRARARARARSRAAAAPCLHPPRVVAVARSSASSSSSLPLRTHLYGGNVLWHEQGMRFSWRVMVREKNGSITFVVASRSERTARGTSSPRKYLTDRQEREISAQPDLVLQLAHHVATTSPRAATTTSSVRVEAIVSLNGRSRRADDRSRRSISLAIEDGIGQGAPGSSPAPEGRPFT